MTFDGFSLFLFLLLAFALPYSAGKLIMCLREMARFRRMGRQMDEINSALNSEDFLGPRPW